MTASAVEWKHRSSDKIASEGVPDWYASGLAHIWLPYAQMKTVRPAEISFMFSWIARSLS